MRYRCEAKRKGYNFPLDISTQISIDIGQKCTKLCQLFHCELPNRPCLQGRNSWLRNRNQEIPKALESWDIRLKLSCFGQDLNPFRTERKSSAKVPVRTVQIQGSSDERYCFDHNRSYGTRFSTYFIPFRS